MTDDAARNARIVGSIDDAIHVVDLDGRIISSTPRGANLLLSDRLASSVGRNWLDMWRGAQRDAAKRAFDDALAGSVAQFTAQAQTKRDSAWFDVTVAPMLSLTGDILEVLVISRDITVRHTADEKLKLQEATYRRIALALQAASLPAALPKIDDLTIDAYYRPSARETTICGDWYDAIAADNNEVLLTIGDIAGHGLNAAVAMTRIKQSMQAVGLLTRDPHLMLTAAEDVMRQMSDDLFATALVSVFDASDRTLQIASAGHPPPIVRDPDGTVRELALSPGPLLGLRVSRQWSTERIHLPPGSAMVMFTDGLIEAEHNISLGYTRLAEAIAREDIMWSSRPSVALVEATLDGKPARDDVAVLVVRENSGGRSPLAAVAEPNL